MDKKQLTRDDFSYLHTVTTRWMDNDIYGHVNNVVYYSFFDSAINCYLIEGGCLDIHGGEVIGLMVHSECDYFLPIHYPQKIEIGVGIARLGNSSVTYVTAVFADGDPQPCAVGSMVHVFVDRRSSRPVAMPEPLRVRLGAILLPG